MIRNERVSQTLLFSGPEGVGKATTFEVLTYQNNLTTARSAEIRALANYNEALATLAQQEGTILEQYNIDLEGK